MAIKVGNVFVQKNGSKPITIIGQEDGIFTCKLDNGDLFTATQDTVDSWVKIDISDIVIPKRKRNKVSLKNVCIDVLKTTLEPMTATEIYKYICEHNLFKFSENAKTPANTIHARIREYMKKDNNNSISHSKGKFIYHLDATIPF